jgi:hypothetical protein
VHFYDEAGDNPFGHEFILVPQRQMVGFVPGVDWFVAGKQDGGDVGVFTEGVADLEVLHQLEQFVVHVGVLRIAPNGLKIRCGKATFVLDDGGGVSDFIDGIGCPGGLEDDPMFEGAIFLEVETNAQVVEVLTDSEPFLWIFDSVAFAEGVVFLDADIVSMLGVVFEGVANFDPGFGDGDTDVGEVGDVGFDEVLNLAESAIGREVGR